jgi:ubiquinone biosynthesis protein
MRCATASFMPTCIPAICSSTMRGRLVAVDFGIMGRLGPKERRFLAEILLGFITRDYRRTAEVHFEAGYVPASLGREFRAGDPRHRRADP